MKKKRVSCEIMQASCFSPQRNKDGVTPPYRLLLQCDLRNIFRDKSVIFKCESVSSCPSLSVRGMTSFCEWTFAAVWTKSAFTSNMSWWDQIKKAFVQVLKAVNQTLVLTKQPDLHPLKRENLCCCKVNSGVLQEKQDFMSSYVIL